MADRVFRRCAGCGDDIWPEEPAGDVCAICRVRAEYAQRSDTYDGPDHDDLPPFDDDFGGSDGAE